MHRGVFLSTFEVFGNMINHMAVFDTFSRSKLKLRKWRSKIEKISAI